MKTTVLDFSEIDAGMLAEVGGKAANLGELTAAGLPVPPGWVLTTEAYRQVAQGLLTSGDDLAERARRHLLEAPVPDAVQEAIVKAYAGLGDDVPVAVRSSATAEDLPFASFAGQQDTFLNVVGAQAVVEAVRRCWASLWTDRAVAYRESNGIDHAAVRLAVVVQRMVDARVAGVMFTANPVTGRRRESVIDASPGLGEAVVSGAVNPDRFRVFDGEILERHAGDKRLAIRSLPGGGTERVETAEPGLCLTDREVRGLAALGARVEAHYGAPQDTEWAIDGHGTLWLTQARPITTLYPLPEPTRPGLRVYFSVNVVQGVMGPLTPMGQSAFKVISAGGAGLAGHRPADLLGGAGFLTVSGERLWLDLTTAVRSRPGRALLPRVLTLGEARAVSVVERLFEDPRLSQAHTSVRPFLRGLARFARNLRLPQRVLKALTRPDQALAATVTTGERLDARLRVPGSATPAQRLDHAERVLAGTFPLIISIMPTVVTGYGLFALASKLSGVPVAEMSDVLRSLPHNPTTEMDLELWRLATRIEPGPFRELSVPELVEHYQEGRLPPLAQREIAAFLDEYGHRGVAEIDLGVPRWSEEPGHILGVLANYLRMDTGVPPSEQFADGVRQARATIAHVAARARRRGRWRAPVVRFALGRTRRYAGLRELPKFYLVKTLAAVRRSLLVVGEHLVGLGVLDSAQDVFFLDLRETRAALAGGDLRALVAERRATYERERRRRHVPRVLLSDGTEPEALSQPGGDGGIAGTPASPGTVTGVARVVLDPIGAHLEPGEILVCPSTDPGWTPLFLTAGGLVMEMGGAMSHGAVVAREYGIPAVVGVPDATHRITSGQRITVNGAAGTVTIDE
ncbi:PEP/pyruvate-binding domain-containing protein [Nonomuraea gerenzanensis]|uniref:Phosphoenolpyruvate synthase n=1 Tax=Nonomuraea gerenzanensis TaxID=93944 RepID=A0A1M4EJR5_9ACTN|nr:PEP/pyruvate-binding domain-containing protein [Nonomuraea gerenzanensis]UBU10703.1 phosphoenolpyruvate synthase [Nonomuraea gerenzanensis]SBO99125.1 Phosphoenolpyruvate synthase [Nonomuraea gerenzanensis]